MAFAPVRRTGSSRRLMNIASRQAEESLPTYTPQRTPPPPRAPVNPFPNTHPQQSNTSGGTFSGRQDDYTYPPGVQPPGANRPMPPPPSATPPYLPNFSPVKQGGPGMVGQVGVPRTQAEYDRQNPAWYYQGGGGFVRQDRPIPGPSTQQPLQPPRPDVLGQINRSTLKPQMSGPGRMNVNYVTDTGTTNEAQPAPYREQTQQKYENAPAQAPETHTGSTSRGLSAEGAGPGIAKTEQNAGQPTYDSHQKRKEAMEGSGDYWVAPNGNVYLVRYRGTKEYWDQHPEEAMNTLDPYQSGGGTVYNVDDSSNWSGAMDELFSSAGVGEANTEQKARTDAVAAGLNLTPEQQQILNYANTIGASTNPADKGTEREGTLYDGYGHPVGNLFHPEQNIGSFQQGFDAWNQKNHPGKSVDDQLSEAFGAPTPTIGDQELQQLLEADRMALADQQGRALRAAMERGARAGVSPEAAIGLQGTMQQQTGIAQAQAEGAKRMQVAMQNYQAKLADAQKKIELATLLWARANDQKDKEAAARAMAQARREERAYQKQMQDLENSTSWQDMLLGIGAPILGGVLGSIAGPLGTAAGSALFGGLGQAAKPNPYNGGKWDREYYGPNGGRSRYWGA